MNKTLRNIKQRVGAIQFGLMRVHDRSGQFTLQVKVAENEGDLLSCLVTDDIPEKSMLNKNVTLIQKYHDDYLYIAGRIKDEMATGKKILSVEIRRACWFVKKTKGTTSWLQQYYIYDPAIDIPVFGNNAA